MFTDPLGLFAFFSLLPGYRTPAYRSAAPSRGWDAGPGPRPPAPSPWFHITGLWPPHPAPPSEADAELLPERRGNASAPMLILTEASDYVVPLMKEGLSGLLEDAEWTAHWHVFCADEKSFEWCRGAVKPGSVCKRTAETLRGAAFNQGDYIKHVWLKWVLIRKALAGELGPVGSVLFLDADVAVLSGDRPGLEQCLLRPLKSSGELPNFQYQQSPYGGVNGGVLWFRHGQPSLDFVDAVYAMRAHRRIGDDQAWAADMLQSSRFSKDKGFRYRPLPKTLFHSYCMERQWHINITWQARTHHPTCREGTTDKMMDVQRARRQWQESLMAATRQGISRADPCALA